jgi:hypothetical protein
VGNCSFAHCGIEPPKTKAEMEAAIKEYLQHPQAKMWGWDIMYSPEVTTIHDDGTVIINRELERQLHAKNRWSGWWPGSLEARALGIDLNRFHSQGWAEKLFVKPKKHHGDET